MLPDEVLLEIFDFFEAMEDEGDEYLKNNMKAWQALVHVCRRWRSVVFGSPRRLELKLVCTSKTPARDTLDVWPALPLVIEGDAGTVDNIIALLECRDRINQIRLWGFFLDDILEAMEVPFPELTYLVLHPWIDETEPVLPLSDSFLGGSAPRLQYLDLNKISFPGLPKLLSTATHLTDLHLFNIPHSGYISPEVMVGCLSLLTNLGGLTLEFESPQSRPDRESQRSSPPKRTILPVFSRFWFKGVSEYLEAFVARIDAPRLNFLDITFFNDIVFDTPQFTRLVSDTPTLDAFEEASVALGDTIASFTISSKISSGGELNARVLCRELDWQLSFLEQVCTSSLPPLSTLEDLYIYEDPYEQPVWEDNIDSALWLELLLPFTTVKDLFLSEKIAPCVMSALQELAGGRTTEVLPTLQNVFTEGLQPSGPVQEAVEKFVAARQVAGHPIAISRWDRDPTRPQVPHIIDLSMLPEEGPTTAHIGLDPLLGSSADRPIELDLEGMDSDMSDVDVSLIGDD